MAEEAVVVHAAREHAHLVDALLVEGALAVRRAGRNAAAFKAARLAVSALAVPLAGRRDANAFRLSRSGEAGSAVANLLVVLWSAEGVEAARSFG